MSATADIEMENLDGVFDRMRMAGEGMASAAVALGVAAQSVARAIVGGFMRQMDARAVQPADAAPPADGAAPKKTPEVAPPLVSPAVASSQVARPDTSRGATAPPRPVSPSQADPGRDPFGGIGRASERLAASFALLGVAAQSAARAIGGAMQINAQGANQAGGGQPDGQQARPDAGQGAVGTVRSIGAAAQSATSHVLGIANALARVGQVTPGNALAAMGDVLNNVGRVGQAAAGAVSAGLSKIGEVATKIGGPVGIAVGAVAQALSQVVGMAGKVIGFFASLPGIAASSLQTVASYVALIDPAGVMRFNMEVRNLGAAIGSILRPILEAATPLIVKMNEWFTGLASTLAGPLSRIMSTVVSGLERVWDAVRSLGNAFAGLWDTITGGNGAENGFRAFISVMVDQVEILVKALRNLLVVMDVLHGRTMTGKWKTGSLMGDLKEKTKKSEEKGTTRGGKTIAAGQSSIQAIDEASKRLQQAALSAGHKSEAEQAAEETAENTEEIAEESVKQTSALDKLAKALEGIVSAIPGTNPFGIKSAMGF